MHSKLLPGYYQQLTSTQDPRWSLGETLKDKSLSEMGDQGADLSSTDLTHFRNMKKECGAITIMSQQNI